MYCRNCAKEISEQVVYCVGCGVSPKSGNRYCQNCAAETNPMAEICTQCGVRLSKGAGAQGEGKDWLTTLLFCIFLGNIGIHRFYTGHTGIGIAQIFTWGGCGIWWLVDLILIASGSFKDSNGNPLVKK